MPAQGPLIVTVHHSNMLDGPTLVGTAPRPVPSDQEEDLRRPTQPVSPWDRAGGGRPREAGPYGRQLGGLARGGVFGFFPERARGEGDFATLRAGLAYFASRSGAQVRPVAVLGSIEDPGRLTRQLLRPRNRVDVVFGDAFEVGDGSGRKTRTALDEAATVGTQERLTGHLAEARRLTGR